MLLFLPGERESTKAEIEWSDLCSGGARRIVMQGARPFSIERCHCLIRGRTKETNTTINHMYYYVVVLLGYKY